MSSSPTRRTFLTALGSAVPLLAQSTQRDWSGQQPVHYPDPDIVALDKRYQKYMLDNTTIKRLYTGTLWAEGTAWSGVGKYLVWSDIPNNVQMRWIEEDGRVTVFRNPSNYSNGNTFDFEGRQLCGEHGGRRVARYEHNGTVTTIADRYQGKRLNAPNDLVVHPDGSIWFTDPTYGISGNYEGYKADPELKQAVYRVDSKTGQIDKLTDAVDQPNGICFSPDYKKLYVADTGDSALDIKVWDIDGKAIRNGRRLLALTIPRSKDATYADGIRCDTDGNLWCGTPAGVQIVAADGAQIGWIRLPETCANLCFGGSRRNRLFMAGSQSLYSVNVAATGAHIT